MKPTREILQYLRSHWVHLLILPVMAIVITIVHEAAHSFAVLAQGGTVTEFSFLPSKGHWGFVNYEFPLNRSHSNFAISMAPYLLWLFMAAAVTGLAFATKRPVFWLASTLYVWGFAVPLADIGNAAFAWLTGSDNDFRHALGAPSLGTGIFVCCLAAGAVVAGLPVHRRLYAERGLSIGAYFALAALCVAGVVACSGAM